MTSPNEECRLEGHDGAKLVVEEVDGLLTRHVFGSDLGLLDHLLSISEVAVQQARMGVQINGGLWPARIQKIVVLALETFMLLCFNCICYPTMGSISSMHRLNAWDHLQ